ncbi:MAG TPA: SDR family oxidoreductase [Spirochaetia bacterium]|nr:SDR family oxidoreductase [Spirochaetia bacterium]
MLKDKAVAISGAAGGLGPTIARAFHDGGACLALAGRDTGKLTALLDSLGASREKRMATSVDLVDQNATGAWADAIVRTLGRVDIVVHLVGGYKGGTAISEIQTADWDSLHDMLVKTTLNIVRAFARPLASGGWGRFLAVTSPRAQAPTGKNAIYAAAKSASDAFVLALASELAGTGATANLIVVDSIQTEGAAAGGAAPKKPYGKLTPAGEIAAAMLFLCSDQAGTINGARLPLMGRG